MWYEGGRLRTNNNDPKHMQEDYDGFSSESELSDDDFETESQGRIFVYFLCMSCVWGGFRGTLDWHATASCQMSSRLFAISVKQIAYYKWHLGLDVTLGVKTTMFELSKQMMGQTMPLFWGT